MGYRWLKQARQQRNQSDHDEDGLWHRSLGLLNVGLTDLPVNLLRVTGVSYTDFGVQAPRKCLDNIIHRRLRSVQPVRTAYRGTIE
jgi:hypothetical protein